MLDVQRKSRTASCPLPAVRTENPACSSIRFVKARIAASSSTTRIVPLPGHGSGNASSLRDRTAAGPLGRKVDAEGRALCPISLDTWIAPLWPWTMPWTADSPNPRPVNFVVKKGSNILARVCPSMPQPVSETCKQTQGPSGISGPTSIPGRSSGLH